MGKPREAVVIRKRLSLARRTDRGLTHFFSAHFPLRRVELILLLLPRAKRAILRGVARILRVSYTQIAENVLACDSQPPPCNIQFQVVGLFMSRSISNQGVYLYSSLPLAALCKWLRFSNLHRLMSTVVITRRLLLNFSNLLLHIVSNPRVHFRVHLFLNRLFSCEYIVEAICRQDGFGLPYGSGKLEGFILDDPFLEVVDASLKIKILTP